jgi:hypothetical protein
VSFIKRALWQSKLQKKTKFAVSSVSINPLAWNFRFSKLTMYQLVEDFFTGYKPGRVGNEICLGPPKLEI